MHVQVQPRGQIALSMYLAGMLWLDCGGKIKLQLQDPTALLAQHLPRMCQCEPCRGFQILTALYGRHMVASSLVSGEACYAQIETLGQHYSLICKLPIYSETINLKLYETAYGCRCAFHLFSVLCH